MPDNPIEISSLVKRFGTVNALNGLDLVVESGSVHGFLGPNGAGKSTAIRVLLGMYRPNEGYSRVLGLDPVLSASRINRRLAYVPGEVALWPNLTGGQALDTLAGLRGSRDEAKEKDLIERFCLDPTKKIRTYSKGNRQKVALIAALAAPVDLFLLDEPTSGLDPLMENVFTEVIGELMARGATVLLSSHILAEVQALCSRVTIIKEGRVVEDGDLAALQALSLTTITVGAVGDERQRVGRALEDVGLEIDEDGHRLRVSVESKELPAILATIAALGLTDVRVEPASLEDLFLSHYADVNGGDSYKADTHSPATSRRARRGS